MLPMPCIGSEREIQQKGFLIGSCSDRPLSGQRAIWEQYNIPVDFLVSKHMLPDVKAKFEADVYCHIGDREDLVPSGRPPREVMKVLAPCYRGFI